MTAVADAPRRVALELALALERDEKDAPRDALILFLDTLTSLEELERCSPVLTELGKQELLKSYREDLLRWPDPKLPEGFDKKFPQVAARLDSPEKVRVLLRAMYWRSSRYHGITPEVFGEVFEELITRFGVGEEVIKFERYFDPDPNSAVLRIVYHTEYPYWALTQLLLPEKKWSRHGTGGLLIGRIEMDEWSIMKL